MSGRFVVSIVALAAAGALLFAGVASAGVESNPNAFPAQDLVCDNGLTSDSLLIVGRTGHVPPGSAGVATKVEVFVSGPGWVTLFDVPGSGFDKLTTDCTWFGPDGSEFRGEILLRGNLR